MSDIRLLIAAMWFIMRYRSRQDWGNQIEEAWVYSGDLLEDLEKVKKKSEKEIPF
jgi:hypothetical protein